MHLQDMMILNSNGPQHFHSRVEHVFKMKYIHLKLCVLWLKLIKCTQGDVYFLQGKTCRLHFLITYMNTLLLRTRIKSNLTLDHESYDMVTRVFIKKYIDAAALWSVARANLTDDMLNKENI